ncbi:MAG: hypothetical protein AAGA77_22395 [Bacteroidota bacterium]
MKKIIYIFTAIVLLASCKSIDKMIESGNYDEALRFGVDKLRGEKNKKTKYVKGLEKAYAKLNRQDLNKIKHLELSGQRNNLDRIVDIYHNMERRQNYVIPLLPLISEDGYLAEIKIVDYSGTIHEASLAAATKHYDLGLTFLSSAKTNGNKIDARNAYNHFEDAQSYFSDYKNTYDLLQEAYNLGQSRILIESYTKGSNVAFDHTLDIISEIQIHRLNNKWEKFYIQDNGSLLFDYVATLEVNEIVPGIERESVHSFVETKEIIDGQIPIKDQNGNLVTDTLGNTLYADKFKEISAFISEVQREKIAHMAGRLVVIEAIDNIHIKTIPINVTHEFRDYACTFQGDRRALSQPTLNRIKSNVDPFPTDFEITSLMAYSYKEAAEKSLHGMNFKR